MDPVSAIVAGIGNIFSGAGNIVTGLSPLFGNNAKDEAREDLQTKEWFQQLSASEQEFKVSLEAVAKRKSAEKKLIILSIVAMVVLFGVALFIIKLKRKK